MSIVPASWPLNNINTNTNNNFKKINITTNMNLNGYIRAGYSNKMKTNVVYACAQLTAAFIPLLTVILGFMAKRIANSTRRFVFLTAQQRRTLNKYGFPIGTGRNVANDLLRITNNINLSNKNALARLNQLSAGSNTFNAKIKNLKNKQIIRNAAEQRVYVAFMKVLLVSVMILNIVLGEFGSSFLELGSIGSYRPETINDDVQKFLNAIYGIISILPFALYTAVQQPAVTMLGGQNFANMSVGVLGVILYQTQFSQAIMQILTEKIKILQRLLSGNQKAGMLIRLFGMAVPNASYGVQNLGTNLIRILKESLIRWQTVTAGLMLTGLLATIRNAIRRRKNLLNGNGRGNNTGGISRSLTVPVNRVNRRPVNSIPRSLSGPSGYTTNTNSNNSNNNNSKMRRAANTLVRMRQGINRRN